MFSRTIANKATPENLKPPLNLSNQPISVTVLFIEQLFSFLRHDVTFHPFSWKSLDKYDSLERL